MLEQARRFIPATQIFEQFTKRNKVQSMLYIAAIWVLYHLISVCQQGGHRHHIHGIVIEHPTQLARIARS